MMITIAYTVVDEDTVVIEFRDASLAYTTMLGSSRFQNVACPTGLSWMKYGMIVRIQSHGLIVVFSIDVTGIGNGRKIQKEVW